MNRRDAGHGKDFEVATLPKRAWVTVLLISLAPLLFMLVASLLQPAAASATGFAVASAGCALLTAFLLSSMARRRVRIENGVLRISAAFYTCKADVSALDVAGARIVDLREHAGLRPQWKTNGCSVPGFHAGHYRLREGGRAFCLLTDPARVLVLPERSGRRLLLSLDQPRKLLEALEADAIHAR